MRLAINIFAGVAEGMQSTVGPLTLIYVVLSLAFWDHVLIVWGVLNCTYGVQCVCSSGDDGKTMVCSLLLDPCNE